MLEILAETSDWLAVNKPCGIVVEAMPQGFLSVEEVVGQYLTGTKREPFVGIVHRLDRPVSGVLLLAKKRSTLKILNAQFAERRVEKRYWAWVQNTPADSEQVLTHWLKTDTAASKALITNSKNPKAALCRLQYRILAVGNGGSKFPMDGVGAILEVKPETGKFHQIRAQLAAIGSPIVGDEKYGSTKLFAPNAIALHAVTLSFFDPSNGDKRIVLSAPCAFFEANKNDFI